MRVETPHSLWAISRTAGLGVHRARPTWCVASFPGDICDVRCDNEVGKGDHRHIGVKESVYTFTTQDKLIADFRRDIARWNRENRHS